MNSLCTNGKTYRSLDLSTNCPKRQAGKPCSYCYVETARKTGIRAKQVHDKLDYNNDILGLKQDTIDKLNTMGGLRLFSFGDYMEWMDEDLMKIISDAKEKGLKLKAITKVPEFVHKYHDHIDLINVSVDNLNEGMDINVAKQLKNMYDNVRIRAAIMNENDISALSWVDVLTLNHARNGYHVFTPTEKAKIGEQYPDKLCCATNKCETCKIKCGK
ncbi:MAG TPA: hypothetical protein VK190_02845 [Pseudoneobacillus sp.]|nr:hypothetical protein [Pseudoneobacillus sp.]